MTTIDMGTIPGTPTVRSSVMRRLPRILALWTLSVIVLAVLAVGFMRFDDIEVLWLVPVDALVLVVACTAMMDLIYAARWRIWLTSPQSTCPVSLASLWTFVTWSRVASQILPIPAGSLGVRAAAVKSAGNLTVRRALSSVAVDPMLDLYQFLLILPVTAALVLGYATPVQAAIAIGAMLLLGGVALATLFPVLIACVHWARRRLPLGKPNADTMGVTNLPLRRSTLLAAYALTVCRYLFVGLRIWAVALAVGLSDLSPLYCLCTGTVTQAAHMATITPGALGVLEGGWFAVLRASGIAAHDATLFVTAQRILLWIALAVIALALTAVFAACRRRADQPLGTGADTVAPSADAGVVAS